MDGIVKNHRSLWGKKDLDAYLAPSPYQDDRGEKIGRVPQEISVASLKALGGPQSPIRAIRAKRIELRRQHDRGTQMCCCRLRAVAVPDGQEPVLRQIG